MMPIEDWIPDFDFCDVPSAATCDRCGAPLSFLRDVHSRKWRPIDMDGKPHRCPASYASARDFPKLEE